MQFMERSLAPPKILGGSVARMQRQTFLHALQSGDEKLTQSKVLRSAINLEHESLKDALKRQFRGRCAFCETEVSTETYKFRPASDAQPYEDIAYGHLYYLWLDLAWENYYSICASCKPPQPEFFPVEGKRAKIPSLERYAEYAETSIGLWEHYPPKEKPYFLEPCVDQNIHLHLGVRWDGVLYALTQRGYATIEHFNLNSKTLIRARHQSYQRRSETLFRWVAKTRKDDGGVFVFPDQEYGGTWYLLLRRLASSVGIRRGTRPMLSMNRIRRVFLQLRETKDGAEHLRRCWLKLARHRPGVAEFRTTHPKLRISKVTSTEIVNLDSVRISNFKSIESLELDLRTRQVNNTAKTRATLIIGENATGKSSILEAIALALCSQQARDKLGLTARSLILDPAFQGSPNIRAHAESRIDARLSNGKTQTLLIAPEHLTLAEDATPYLPVFAYGAFRQYQHKALTRRPDTYIRNLFDGSILSNPEPWLLRLKPDQFAMVVRALREILSIDGEFEVIRRDYDNAQCFVVTATNEDGTPAAQSTLNVASSGFRSVLAMACDIIRGLMDKTYNPGFQNLESAHGIVLIDEVEAHLHPRWKMRIMRGLRQALPGITFIATTHDPLCLRGMEDGEVVVLHRVHAQDITAAGLATTLEARTDLPPISELRIDQLLTSDFFQLHSTDAPEMDSTLAQIGDLLKKPPEQRTPQEQIQLQRFNDDIANALPIGTSEAHRVVQEAVAEYLAQRRQSTQHEIQQLRDTTRQAIVNALRSL